jgi:trehalose-phosphatase
MSTTDALMARVAELATTPVLLVACDYDGTLAPIVDDPAHALPMPEAVAALRTLASLPDTYVAVISGRSLRDLAVLSRLPSEVHLVGSHGSEFDLGFATTLSAEAKERLATVLAALLSIADRTPGAWVETKPASAALHVRTSSNEDAERAIKEALEGPGRLEGITAREGKRVAELLVVGTDKGRALNRVRHNVAAGAVLFVGDDVTDEDAFRSLAGPDVGVKVGEGATAAAYRVDSPTDAAVLLARVCDMRQKWLSGAGAVPIENHSLLSDQYTMALLTPAARITWLCLPRLDSAAVFAELVGGPRAGYFAVGPVSGSFPIGQRYLDHSLVLQTRWPGLSVIDYLDIAAAGRGTRLVRVIDAEVPTRITFAPRLDFGRMATAVRVLTDGIRVYGGADPLYLYAPGVEWNVVAEGIHETAVADVSGGQRVVLELVFGDDEEPAASEPERRRTTTQHWSRWAAGLELPSVAPDVVRHAAVVLRGLCHTSTGAIVAAATTSLPEEIGGVRNWDYRFCWIRDGALTAGALTRLGATREALAFLDWIVRIVDQLSGPDRLRPLYSVDGRDLLPEAVIPELSGYAGSRPVRVGNIADHQIQLDVFGPVAELILLLAQREVPLAPRHVELLEAMVGAVSVRWREPDHGIWEQRLAPRQRVHSKVMCWTTVDRALRVAGLLRRPVPDSWAPLGQAIAEDVLAHGWKDDVRAFGAAYDGHDLDAAALHVGLSGMLRPGDPRFIATVHAVETYLRAGPVVYRYRSDDGLPGNEGGFLMCSLWLADAYALVGRHDDARALFDDVVDLAGPTGMLAEQYEPTQRHALGNLPQAYSHLAVIDTAVRLAALNS